ncbi:MAG: hypothetical protein WCG93_08750 [Paludibacter sp.]
MKRKFIFALLFLLFCVKQVNAQQEFFVNTNGLTFSGSTNFISLYGGGVDLYLKNNVIISGAIADIDGYSMYGGGIEMLITGKNYDNPSKGILGISYTKIPGVLTNVGINAGVLQVFLKDTNFPLSLSAVANLSSDVKYSTVGSMLVTPIIGYTQSFFAHNQVYPVIGVSYQLLLDKSYYSHNQSAFLVHAGLNIKLEKSNYKQSKIIK